MALLAVSLPVAAQLQGTYTIGGSSPDYATINAAVADLTTQGVSGAVVFDLRPGTYAEQVELGAVNGASGTNTITFQAESGNASDVIISYAASGATDNYVLQFNGASHYRIKHLTIDAGGSSHARAVAVINEAEDLLIQNSQFSSPETNSTTTHLAVLYLEPTLASDIHIRDNRITGGSRGIYYTGSTTAQPTGTEITGNTVENFRYQGISLSHLEGGILTGNRIIGKLAGYSYYGLYTSQWDGTAAAPALVANNFVAIPHRGSQAVYLSRSEYLGFYHNSVYAAEDVTAFNLPFAQHVAVKNNIFRAGTGDAVNIFNPTSLDMDYNNLFSDGSFLGWWGSTQVVDLAAWQTTSGQGGNSLGFDPQFVSATDLHAQAPALADAGIAISGLTTDIDGELRDATPSVGADEYSAAALSPLSGTYSIGGAGADFATFNTAVDAMRINGISGAVTFNAAAGTYPEQLEIPAIPGASATHTITFQSATGDAASVILSYGAATAGDNYVVRLSNASNVRLQHLTLEATGITYNRVVEVVNRADDLLLAGNRLLAPETTSASLSLSVVHLNPTLASNIHIRDNRITGGSRGIYFAGSSGAQPTGTEITDNVVEGFRYQGVALFHLQGGLLTGNRIIGKPGEYTYYGLYVSNWDGTTAAPVLVANNFVSLPHSGNQGVYLTGSQYLNFYHNSVHVAGNGTALNMVSTGDVAVKNNIFRAGTGDAVNVSSATSLDMDYNNLFSDGSFLGWWGSTQVVDLAAWRTTSGQGSNSLGFDPQFVSATDLHAQAPALADAGIAIPGLTTDIDGELRDATPSVGADEYSATALVPLSGTYTIGGEAADFATFNAAVDAMRINGISGAVTFNAAAATYPEQLEIPAIPGASMTHTITFQSASGDAASVILSHGATTAADNYVVRLSNASNVRLQHLTLEATGEIYSRVVEVVNRADDLLLAGNRLLAPQTTSASLSLTVLDLNPTLASNIHIRDNRISGGSRGIYFAGSSSAPPSGTEVTDNVVEDFRYQGIALFHLQGGMLTGNRIIGKPGVYTYYGLYVSNWDGTAAAPVLVANNFVSLPHSGTQAVYLASSEHLDFYHNSVYAAGGGTAFNMLSSESVAVKNNIFRAGTGEAVNVSNATSLDMDYNNLYSDGSFLGWWGGNQVADLPAWRTISNQGTHSLSVDPQFVSATDLHTQNLALSEAGISISEIDTDIDGEERSDTPSIGADEFGTDGDDIDDDDDNCPNAFNPDQEDFDNDGIGDICDPDDDNDEVADTEDCDPYNASIHTQQVFYADRDRDGYGDASVTLTDCTAPAGYVSVAGDCDDGDRTVYPGAPELCDGVDNDCDGNVDEGLATATYYADADGDGLGDPTSSIVNCAQPAGSVSNADDCNDGDASVGVATIWYADVDNDGYGDASITLTDCTAPTGYVSVAGDCNDGDGTVYPGAPELCDGLDNDCDGNVDEGLATATYYADADGDGLGDPASSVTDCAQPAGSVGNGDDCNDGDASVGVATIWYADVDNDGYGDAETQIVNCTAPVGYVSVAGDCDDGDGTVYPGAPELCDGLDNDCDGNVDEDVATSTYYADADGDGLGDPTSSVTACAQPLGYVSNDDDCDDGDASIGAATIWYADEDNDGYGDAETLIIECTAPAGYVSVAGDCDDGNGTVYPGAPELCDGLDNDCDGNVDEDVATATYYADADGDGLGDPTSSVTDCAQPEGYVSNADDCDDGDASVGVATIWYADVDNDGFGDAETLIVNCTAPAGYVSVAGDCDDGNGTVYPGAPELCDGVDNDCDGSVDEDVATATYYADADGDGLGDPANSVTDCAQPEGYVSNADDCDDGDATIGAATIWYADGDNDGYGNASITLTDCTAPAGYVSVAGDCDDGNATVYLRAPELCDGLDNDCDGNVDEDVATSTYYADADGDGLGDPTSSVTACAQPLGYVSNADDCDDGDATIGVATIWYADVDNDGYGDASITLTDCAAPTGYVSVAGDCDDGDETVYPGAPELCDGLDNDCNGNVDEDVATATYYADADGDGLGDPASSVTDCAQPLGYVSNANDCDDGDATIGVAKTWYADVDMDGYGDGSTTLTACVKPIGYVTVAGDCDDNDALAYPGQQWYIDRDRDGYPESTVSECSRPTDGFAAFELTSTAIDNCPGTFNPGQSDSDGDGTGDDCDTPDSELVSDFWLEAECGTVGNHWKIAPDANASNQTFVHAPGKHFIHRAPADVADNRIRFTLDRAEAGSYFLHVRAFSRNRGEDSFWIRLNDGEWIKWNNIDCDSHFKWSTMPVNLELESGTNTLDVAFREGGTMLDKVFISQNGTLPTGFGDWATNCPGLSDQPPTAIASASRTHGIAPLTVHFDGSRSYDFDGHITGYNWTWEGGSASGPKPTVVFDAGVYQVKLQVTDDSGLTNSTTITVEATAPTAPDSSAFSFEAECTARDDSWHLSASTEASGNRFVSYTGCQCMEEPAEQRAGQHLTYDFLTTQSNTFYLFLRLDAPDEGRNSFWVRVDDGDWIKMWKEEDGSPLLTSGFEWRRVNNDARPISFDLAPGEHSITVASREPGTKLDKLILSADNSLPHGTGAPAQNCTETAIYTGGQPFVEERVVPYNDDLFITPALAVYPNPATNQVSVELSDGYLGVVTVSVVDALGRQILHRNRNKEDQVLRTELSVADLPHGLYHLLIRQGDCQTVRRFVKQ
ncbi:pectin methylesterase-like acyl-CoA thioesterase [Lewinella marina]|uniref:MopE-related protein n=1 Tax=Neolewinella marina TaxID=438751 RepID=UPI00142F5E76|nr:pectin methylesterase-like acyl-CoA thioesterase [Neolewinella marina]